MVSFRNATMDDVSVLLSWAQQEGWNPGLEDAAAFFAADPEGFFVAEHEGAPVAGISVVNHTEAFAFLGLYIVVPAYRGQGIGFALWTHALAHAGQRTVGLDGVPDQQDNYLRSGFEHAGATTRYVGPIVGAESDLVRAADPADLPRLIEMEALASGVEKRSYLSSWFATAETRKTFVMGETGAPTALCTIRLCDAGAKIGPLVADTAEDAGKLIRHAAAAMACDITLDVPGGSEDLVQWCQAQGMVAGFLTARMYRGAAIQGRPGIFAVATLELG